MCATKADKNQLVIKHKKSHDCFSKPARHNIDSTECVSLGRNDLFVQTIAGQENCWGNLFEYNDYYPI